jgi:hypothetical protein
MPRILALLLCLVSGAAVAQPHMDHHTGGGPAGHPMAHGQVQEAGVPVQAGQAAFAAIQEIVDILMRDPGTDWSKVDIEALRRHLIDMDNVTLRAAAAGEAVPGGMRYTVTGEGAVRDSIRRMVTAHAATMDGADGWSFDAAETAEGAVLTVRPPAGDMDRLLGLGFIGVMASGMHHQEHHLMLARGGHPH